ncbi:MAG: DedA family protein [bacterium]
METHAVLAYAVLFAGAYFETLIGPNFFIYGELIFIPGATLAGLGFLDIWLVMFSVYLGGILGDSSSYWIGARWGHKMFREKARFLSHANYQKGKEVFEKYGLKSIFFARMLGPISWLVPFFAGIYKVPYRKFIVYNVPGVIVGIGQFLVVGYFFGNQYKLILAIVQKYGAILLGVILVLFIIYSIIKNYFPEFFSPIKRLWGRVIQKVVKK